MTLQLKVENGISRLIGDNTAEFITLSPGQLTNIPGGVLALGGNDTVIGSADSELIFGNEGQDSISGGAGNDTLFGSKDNDQLDGGTGNDSIRGDLGDDIVRGGDDNDTLLGGKGNDQLFGDAGDDFLSGDQGNDTLTGGLGSDRFALSTGGGLDIITDFENGSDLILLPNGLNFDGISIQSAGANAVINVKSTGESLAQLNNVQASSITSVNFAGSGVQPSPGSSPSIPFLPKIPLPPIGLIISPGT
jgi:Ca2+-binding RTX toxin-like protein